MEHFSYLHSTQPNKVKALREELERPKMFARVWRGVTKKADADAFFEYMKKTGVKDLYAMKGNQGILVLKRERARGKHVEFILMSLWESLDSIRRFAGDDIEKAYYPYPEDEKYLLKLEPKTAIYEVPISLIKPEPT